MVGFMISNLDIGQSVVRLVIGIICLSIIVVFEKTVWPTDFSSQGVTYFFFTLSSYILLSLIITFSTVRYLKPTSRVHLARRVVGVVLDLFMAGMGLHFTEEYSLIAFSVVLTIIIGYGFRFGIFYLLFGIVVGVIVVGLLATRSSYYIEHKFISSGLLVSVILVPIYASSLLGRYQKVLRELEETNIARSRFIANMSHELRTPLYAILLNAESLLEVCIERDEHKYSAIPLQIITTSARHLKNLVDRVLDIASGEAGAFTLQEREKIDFYYLLRNAVDIGSAPSIEKNVDILMSIDPSTPRFFWCWNQQLTEVIINTVGNAAKFTENGTILIQTHATLERNKGAERELFITVTDTGIGMTAAQLSSAFAPFVLGDDTSARQHAGTGIGLAITKQYVDAMGGTIQLSSSNMEGVTVAIKLPCDECEPIVLENKQRSCSLLYVTDRTYPETWTNNLEPLGVRVTSYSLLSSDEFDVAGADALIIDNELDSDKREIILKSTSTPKILCGEEYDLYSRRVSGDYLFKISKITPSEIEKVLVLCGAASLSDTNLIARYTKNLLLIDDNENNLASAELVLRNAGHKVDAVTSGDEGISKLLKHQYDLVFIDMHMPKKNGLETLISAKQVITGELPPVVFLTADVTTQAEIDASAVGISGFLTKPISPSSLRNAVERFGAKSPVLESVSSANNDELHSVAYGEVDDMLARGISKDEVLILLEKFSSDINQNFLHAAVLAAQEDAKHVRKLIHRMQGSAGAMHFSQLAGRFASLEEVSEADLCQRYLASAVDLQTLSDSLVHDMKNYLFDES